MKRRNGNILITVSLLVLLIISCATPRGSKDVGITGNDSSNQSAATTRLPEKVAAIAATVTDTLHDIAEGLPNDSLALDSVARTVVAAVRDVTDSVRRTGTIGADTIKADSATTSDISRVMNHNNSVRAALDSIVDENAIVRADTARYIIVGEDTVFLNRGGYTGRDTTAIDTTRRSSQALDAPVAYTAKDSITFDYAANRANLYGDANVKYTNLELQANLITMAMDSSVVHAIGTRDSTGKMLTPPVFKQGEDEYEPDQIAYNFKTRKAFINNVFTEQGEGYLTSRESKRDSSGVMYIRGGKYTTCDARHPHFYLALTRAKVRPGKDVVFGPAYLVVEDVPLPLAIPYGFFPFTESYSSGIIMPTYGDETNRGFYLRDGGYYFAINDLIDLKLLGEIYTKGSWGVSAQSIYRKRYRFSGSFNFSYQNTVEGEKNMPDHSVQKSFKLQWSHRQDSKANPTQTFSASVNFATSSFERNNLTSMYNPQAYTQSTRTSSISYSKSFSKIGLTLSATMNLSQNVRDSSISLTLPSLNISLARFNPFKRKKMVGAERWYEKIAMSYTGTFSNSISTKEDKLLKSNFIKDWRNGMKHTIPVSASFVVGNYINITPSFNFNDRMYTYKVRQGWDTDKQVLVRDTVMGFYNVFDYNFSVQASTKLYGTYTPLIGKKKVMAIRHVLTPTISFSYAPDFGASRYGYWDTYTKTDAEGNVSTVTYSPFAGALYSVPSQGQTGSITLDVGNNVEMKLRTANDSTKKISLIDEFGFSMSYNLAAKSRPWSDLNTRLRLKLTKNYTFSLNAVFATYAYEIDDKGNVRVGDKTEYSQGRFGRFQGLSQNISYTFNNQTFRKLFGKDKDKDPNEGKKSDADIEDEHDMNNTNMDPDLNQGKRGAKRKATDGETDEDGYVPFQLPWSLSVSYGISLRENTSGTFNTKRMRYPYGLTHTLNFSGNLQIASGWNITWSSGYDFNYKKISMTTASLSRDLHCFSMSCSVVLAPYSSFNFTFQANASTLADALKWKKQSSYSNNIQWY